LLRLTGFKNNRFTALAQTASRMHSQTIWIHRQDC